MIALGRLGNGRISIKKKVVGNFPIYAPKELVHAAGMLPVTIMGFGSIEIQYADSMIQSSICSITRSTLELGLTKRIDMFDAMIFPYICDDARNLAHFSSWGESLPDMKVLYLDLPQNPDLSSEFYVSELEKLKRKLEDLGGLKITDDMLRGSIEKYNQERELIRGLYSLKRESPWKISMLETYAVVKAGNFLPVEEHIALLREILDEAQKRRSIKKDNARIVIEGSICEQPPLEVIREIEEAGCYIVDEDFLIGSRLFNNPIGTDNPLESLAKSYATDTTYLAVKYDGRNVKRELFLQKVQNAKADAVIFLYPKFCKPVEYDLVLFKEGLDELRIPYTMIEYAENIRVNIKDKVGPFSESVLLHDSGEPLFCRDNEGGAAK